MLFISHCLITPLFICYFQMQTTVMAAHCIHQSVDHTAVLLVGVQVLAENCSMEYVIVHTFNEWIDYQYNSLYLGSYNLSDHACVFFIHYETSVVWLRTLIINKCRTMAEYLWTSSMYFILKLPYSINSKRSAGWQADSRLCLSIRPLNTNNVVECGQVWWLGVASSFLRDLHQRDSITNYLPHSLAKMQ